MLLIVQPNLIDETEKVIVRLFVFQLRLFELVVLQNATPS